MAFGNNAIGILFIVMVLCATRAATRSVAKENAAEPDAAPEGSAAAPGAAAAAATGIFDITKLGARADGKTDSTKALQDAWNSACEAAGQPTILVPKGDFLVGPLNFSGPCKGDLTFQIDGTLLGSNDLDKYVASWIEIMNVSNIAITGFGTLDGQGSIFWDKDCTTDCKILPNTLVLDFVKNGSISGITLRNSKFFHINLYMSTDVTIRNVTISSPGDSINTDGIHIGDSSNIAITDAAIGTGDDCISIGGGSRRVSVSGVTCGPGQGISIGCVGRYKDEKDVSEVTVRDCVLRNSTNGVRIKTYEEAMSSITVSKVMFENIRMDEVANPIIIDQKYCPDKVCSVKGDSAVTVKDVSFRNITGTSSTPEVVSLLCLDKQPCSGVQLIDVNVEYTGKNKTIAVCSNAIGVEKDSPEAKACLMS